MPRTDLDVLQVVTTASPFFEQQVRALEDRGVSCTTVAVPDADGAAGTVDAYRRFYQRVLRAGLDDYDLVHANYGLVGPFALAQPTRPVVLTLWGSEVMGESARLSAVSSAAARASDRVVVPSAPISDAFDVSHEVVPFPVDTGTFRPIERSAARAAVDWETDAKVVLFPYHPDRDVKDYPRAERIVAAVDDRLDEPVELRWIWGVPHDEVPQYMNASDAVLVTSSHESGPMVVKEAAACNVPVVSTSVGFAPAALDGVSRSHVRETDDGLVDALASVLAAGERSDGRSVLELPDREQTGERLHAIYRDVLGE
ncbi:glycosyltransferase [Halobacterium yunchengense]|uniref:glycosyltransferase n=1 Tax=Halobacterium yunchengense TaxID=3108497 RepID=UPI003008F76D